MSSSNQQPPRRAKKKKSEEALMKATFKLLRELKNEHRTPYLLSVPSKYGHLHCGSKHVLNKFKMEFGRNGEWEDVFKEDEEEMLEGLQMDDDSDEDDYANARGTILPNKLPADLNLMVYSELWSWISQEILKEHWLKGGKLKCVKWGNPTFKPSFWLNDVWPWHEVLRHYKDLPKSAYTGPGVMTDYLKKVIKIRLLMLGINHKQWISESFTSEQRTIRERHKKKAVSFPIGTADDDDDNDDGNEEDEVHNSQPESEGTEARPHVSLNPDDYLDEQQFVNDSNLTDLLDANDIDLTNLSHNISRDVPLATSTLTDSERRPIRRTSTRQAEKRARNSPSSSVSSRTSTSSIPPRPPVPPPSVSPLRSTSPPRKAPRFVPRRNPIPESPAVET